MTDYIGHKETVVDKIMFGGVIAALVLMFVVFSQPAWRGEEMAAGFKSDCAKRGGVLLQHEGFLGTTYECASNLGGGSVKQEEAAK